MLIKFNPFFVCCKCGTLLRRWPPTAPESAQRTGRSSHSRTVHPKIGEHHREQSRQPCSGCAGPAIPEHQHKGISESNQAAIFRRFYREEEVHEQQGVGIGLYLARIVQQVKKGFGCPLAVMENGQILRAVHGHDDFLFLCCIHNSTHGLCHGIKVADTGKGISESNQAAIFRRFYREEEVHEQQGVGIGLYLAREIVTRQGGYIKVVSEPGKGSEFSIMLPTK